MKKTFVILALVAVSSAAVLGQGISGGVKAGLNFANQNFESDIGDFSPDARTSFHVGFFATIMVSETFGVQPELMYNSAGSKIDLGSLGDAVEKLNYLTVPVMLRYQPVSVFNIHAGPTFGFLLSAESEYDGDSQDNKDSYKGLDLGLGFGAGVDLPLGIGFTARYVLGLSNVSDDPNSDAKLTNNVIQLSATYKLFGK